MGTNESPTEAELAILRVLWERGESTVRDVHEALGGVERTRYTTVLKQLQVMTEKTLVVRDDSQRSHVYSARVEERATEKTLVNSFLERMLAGSAKKMVMHALDSGQITDDEIAEIKRMLRQPNTKDSVQTQPAKEIQE